MPKTPATTPVEWEEIQPFTEPVQMEPGDHFEAIYLGANEVTLTDDDGERVALLHEFQRESETETFGIWGSAVLDKRLADVESGRFVRVQYDGKQTLEGGRTARRYRVWVAAKPF